MDEEEGDGERNVDHPLPDDEEPALPPNQAPHIFTPGSNRQKKLNLDAYERNKANAPFRQNPPEHLPEGEVSNFRCNASTNLLVDGQLTEVECGQHFRNKDDIIVHSVKKHMDIFYKEVQGTADAARSMLEVIPDTEIIGNPERGGRVYYSTLFGKCQTCIVSVRLVNLYRDHINILLKVPVYEQDI